jgi:hypothetical protein
VSTQNLRSGNTKSCGCWRKEKLKQKQEEQEEQEEQEDNEIHKHH